MNDADAASLFARLLSDIMIPAEFSEAIRLQGYDVVEARLAPRDATGRFQISNRLRRWEVRDRLLDFLNQHTAEELRDQLWWLPQE